MRAERLKILVTGGAGFIGSHLVEGLVVRGHRVRVLDNFVSGHVENLKAVRADVEIQEGDGANPVDARKAVRGVDVVYHEAAVPNVARSIEEPTVCQHAGGVATLTMLEAARGAGVRRFLYAGSSAVYGDSARRPKRESMEPHPVSPYAVEKLVGEHYLPVFSSLYGLETLALRYFNVFGPRQDVGCPYSGVVARFILALLRDEPPVIPGDGRQSRDFTYVTNVVEANLLALEAKGLWGQVVNIATGRSTTINKLFGLICKEVGQTGAPIESGTAATGTSTRGEEGAVAAERKACEPLHGPAAPGGVRHSFADVTLAQRLLGYRPTIDLETGVRRTVSWYRNLTAPPVEALGVALRARVAGVAP
jgi:UDP-glucose 4-epimerase